MNSVLVDMNNLMVSKLYSKNVMDKNGYNVENINYDIWKFSVFESVYWYGIKFNADEIVLAVDYPVSWRKLYFPRYKEHRQKTKDKFNVDWKEFNTICKEFLSELKQHFPFKIIQKKYAEGDDVIASIVLNFKNNKYTIVSSDKDYLQLCRKNLKIFSLMKQQFIDHPNPEMFLQESSLVGQQKDNIFNIMTPLDYPSELRKPPFGQKKAEKFFIIGLDSALNQNVEYKRKYIDSAGVSRYYKANINLKERYDFNRNLMDFTKIPESVQKVVVGCYKSYKYPHPKEIYNFFTKYKWPTMLDNFTNIENKLLTLYKSECIM